MSFPSLFIRLEFSILALNFGLRSKMRLALLFDCPSGEVEPLRTQLRKAEKYSSSLEKLSLQAWHTSICGKLEGYGLTKKARDGT
ncbi:MAG: hypothetical protein H6864_00370 [Micavibrio sp.]|nr:hypothetical protein [Micavibrio sp.]